VSASNSNGLAIMGRLVGIECSLPADCHLALSAAWIAALISTKAYPPVLARAKLLAPLAAGRAARMAVPHGLDRNDVSQADNLYVVGQGAPRLGIEHIEREASNEAQARIANIQRPAIGEVNPKGNERVAV